MSHGETRISSVKTAAVAGKTMRNRFRQREASPNGITITTNEVLVKAATARSTPVMSQGENETEFRKRSMYQNNAVASRTVNEVSQTLFTAKKIFSGKIAQANAANLPVASPRVSRPLKKIKRQAKLEKMLWRIRIAIAEPVV